MHMKAKDRAFCLPLGAHADVVTDSLETQKSIETFTRIATYWLATIKAKYDMP